MTVPPTHPKRRRQEWQPPSIGDSYVLDADGSVWHVYQLDRASQQACLKTRIGNGRKWVTADELEQDWTQVPS